MSDRRSEELAAPESGAASSVGEPVVSAQRSPAGVVPQRPSRRLAWGVRTAAVLYAVGLLVAWTAWLVLDEYPAGFAGWLSGLGGLASYLGTVGVVTLFWWAGRPRLTVAQQRAVIRALDGSGIRGQQRSAVTRAIRRGDPEPPTEQPWALPYAQARHNLVPVGAASLLVAAPVLFGVLWIPIWLEPGDVGAAGVVLCAVLGLVGTLLAASGLVVLGRARRARLAVSRWSDPPAPATTALREDPGYLSTDWERWGRRAVRVRSVAVVAVVVFFAGIAACLWLRSDPSGWVTCLWVAGGVVAVQFALISGAWWLAQRHALAPREHARLRRVPLAARAALAAELRHGRAGDPRYDDVALAQARASTLDLAVVPVLLEVFLALSLALATPLTMIPVPAGVYVGLGILAVAMTAWFLRLSRVHQHAAHTLLARARTPAPVSPTPRPSPPRRRPLRLVPSPRRDRR